MTNWILAVVLGGVGMSHGVLGAKLLASHYSGVIYTLDFTESSSSSNGSLSITSQATGCGQMPAWLEMYPKDGTVLCVDESWYGSGNIAQYSVSTDGKLAMTGQLKSTGNSVYGTLYGGSNGKGFVVSAE